jgi:hypothetical protein
LYSVFIKTSWISCHKLLNWVLFRPENGITLNVKIITKWRESPKHRSWVVGERETAVIVVVYNQRALSPHNSCMNHNSSGLSLAGKKLHQQATKTTTFDEPSGVGWGALVSEQMVQIKRTNNTN